MRIKKAGNKIYGAELTAAERKAMNMEIQRQLAEYTRAHELEIDALILWQLHEQLGFGPKRLKRFYDNFAPAIKDLINRYEMDDSDQVRLCTKKLKDELGLDLELMKKLHKLNDYGKVKNENEG